ASAKEIQEGRKQIAEAESQISQQERTLAEQKAVLDQSLIALDKGEAEIQAGEKELEAGRAELEAQNNLVKAGWEEYRKGHQKLVEAERVLADSKAELDQGEQSYRDGIAKLESSWNELLDAQGTLADARKELADARKELDDGWKEYYKEREKALPELADAKREIAKAKADLADLKAGEWYVLGRDAIQNSVEYGSDAERIGNLGKVFPAIFFLVAALVCLTTMTRMIEEERMLIGTMKALGYSKLSISAKYLLYALAATLAGGVLGVSVGSRVLPYVIMKAYGMLYSNVHYSLMPMHPDLCLMAIGFAVLATVGAALAACYKELLSVPAALMRPPVPKTGSRILLERITPVWKRLNFSMKSTIRNLVRYKKRFIMTVVGIGGCMAVLLVSFGLHDSIMAIVDNQYKTIWTYSISCGTEDLKDPADRDSFLAEIRKDQPDITEAMFARFMSVDVSSPAGEKTAYLYVVEDLEKREGFLSLHDRETGQTYDLTEDGVVITEKLGRVLDIKPGDKMTVKVGENEYKEVPVIAAAENYIYNYVYMGPQMYQALYGEELASNEIFLHLKDGLSVDDKKEISEYLMTRDDVNSVTLVEKLQESVDNMLHALDLVVWVLVIAAGLLVFVVTFNLNNINISERRRELASLKVLGFYDKEVAMYVYRENVFLTIFGIIAGFFMGYFLHRYVILSLEVDLIMFGRDIRPVSYLEAAVLTAVFSVLVNLLMNWKLKAIDMVESLKSVE
ncbi:MAG: FtsX-like permease family protein, partial [Lachnospiraceae bacterium]